VKRNVFQEKLTFLQYVLNPDGLIRRTNEEKWDVIIAIGWSWRIPDEIVNNNLVIGMHPSDLPAFAGGSPIQNQIVAGIEKTNATLFRLTSKFDAGDIIDKEPVDITGHLTDVLSNISDATFELIARFITNYPNNTYTKQTSLENASSFSRLQPRDSELTLPSTYRTMNTLTCKELWNEIRCREDPYPNVFFEDETGKLVIKLVEFEPK
jgi:methionyl-tRNA formyltransferase